MDREERLRRIAQLSRRLRWVVWTLAVILVLLMTAASTLTVAWAVGADIDWQYTVNETRIPADELSAAQRAALASLLAPMFVLVVWLVWSWDRLLALYQRGVIFSPANAAIIRRCGQLIIGLGVLDMAAAPITAVVLIDGPAIPIRFQPELGLILVGVAIMLVAHVMSLGAELAEEASLTI